METLLMNLKERKRLVVLTEVAQGKMRLVEAARVLGLSYRQAKRVWRRYGQGGDAGLMHRSRGRPSGRSKEGELRRQVLARYAERYPDFGPTLAAEKLAAEGWVVDHETLRRWLLAEGVWRLRRGRQAHRQWRERKACFGEMVQLDGSHHDWFEGRRGPCVLMVMVDDASNWTRARFFEQETTHASYDSFEGWARAHGLPQSVYVDRDSIYRGEGIPTVAQQLAGQQPQTQFGRAMKQLGVELILANSPQAKGRVERRNGLLQDRLVKELRLVGISDLQGANSFVEEVFLPQLNERFTVDPASPADVHQPVPRHLDEILSWEQERVVQRDWTVAWEGRWYQIGRAEAHRSLVDRRIIVRRLRDGREQLVSGGQKLRYRVLPARPSRPPPAPRRIGRTRLSKPAGGHPWRRFGAATGKAFWRQTRLGARPPTGPQALRRGPRPGGRKAPVRGGATPVGDRAPKRSTS
jgi:molybdenum-dependent DNA-binding transcriptional regulator ModE